jgi:hypothetical protein
MGCAALVRLVNCVSHPGRNTVNDAAPLAWILDMRMFRAAIASFVAIGFGVQAAGAAGPLSGRIELGYGIEATDNRNSTPSQRLRDTYSSPAARLAFGLPLAEGLSLDGVAGYSARTSQRFNTGDNHSYFSYLQLSQSFADNFSLRLSASTSCSSPVADLDCNDDSISGAIFAAKRWSDILGPGQVAFFEVAAGPGYSVSSNAVEDIRQTALTEILTFGFNVPAIDSRLQVFAVTAASQVRHDASVAVSEWLSVDAQLRVHFDIPAADLKLGGIPGAVSLRAYHRLNWRDGSRADLDFVANAAGAEIVYSYGF